MWLERAGLARSSVLGPRTFLEGDENKCYSEGRSQHLTESGVNRLGGSCALCDVTDVAVFWTVSFGNPSRSGERYVCVVFPQLIKFIVGKPRWGSFLTQSVSDRGKSWKPWTHRRPSLALWVRQTCQLEFFWALGRPKGQRVKIYRWNVQQTISFSAVCPTSLSVPLLSHRRFILKGSIVMNVW